MFVIYNTDTGNFGHYRTHEQAGLTGRPVYASSRDLASTIAPISHMDRFHSILTRNPLSPNMKVIGFPTKHEAAKAIWAVLKDIPEPVPISVPVKKSAKATIIGKKGNLNPQSVINAKVKAMKESGFVLGYNRASRAWSIQALDGRSVSVLSAQELSVLDESSLIAFAKANQK